MNGISVGGDAHIAPYVHGANSPKQFEYRNILPRADVGIGPYGSVVCNTNI